MNKIDRLKIFFLGQALVLVILFLIFKFIWLPEFVKKNNSSISNKNEINSRVLKNVSEKISFTWSIVSLINEDKWYFLIKNEFGKEFIWISKNLDLENFLLKNNPNKKFFLKWEKIFEKNTSWEKTWKQFFDIKKISKIEEKKIEQAKKFFYENKLWWYWFLLDENIFKAVKWWSKTFLKNWSGEVIIKFFSFDFKNTNLIKWWFFSEWWKEYEMPTSNWIFYWERKTLKNWEEIFLKNKKFNDFFKNYWVLIQINYGKIWEEYFQKKWKSIEEWTKNEKKLKILKQEIAKFLKTFYFVKKENIQSIKCWWVENILCKTWYFCELFSTEKNAVWKCVKL